MFDFNRAKQSALKSLKNPLLECVVLGPSGAGKSYAIGTLGVKTLYLYGTRESHGPKTASVKGTDKIVPICIDYGFWKDETEERAFTSDESLEYLEAILMSIDWIKSEKFGAIALDGLSVLEGIVKGSTPWAERCKTAAGKHNTFKETEATLELIGQVVNLMKTAQREAHCHIVVTGILDVKEVDGFGAIMEATPKLSGYGLCEALVSFFGDILVVGKMTKGNEVKWKFQSMTDLTRTSKDEVGNLKKALNFSPRVSGVVLPPIMDADFSQVAKLKQEAAK
jgi:hypothetical protein